MFPSERKLIKGVVFKTLVMEDMKIKQKYFKILSVRKVTHILEEMKGFNVIEMKYKFDHTEIMAIDEDSKNTKLVDYYILKEIPLALGCTLVCDLPRTKEKPKYFKYKYLDWKVNYSEGCNEILKDDQLNYTIDRYD